MMKAGDVIMPSLQIRNLPEHLYRALIDKARRSRRSLAQQACVELERMVAAETRGTRRLEAVVELRAALDASGTRETLLDPTDAVREDRER
jgi:plasmid stability protein